MNSHIMWFGRYEGWLRWLCHGVKNYDTECIVKAVKLFDLMLPDACRVVPMPPHTGGSGVMHQVCIGLTIKRSRNKLTNTIYSPVLECEPHESNYIQKKEGRTPQSFKMECVNYKDDGLPVFILDNVISSGVTAAAALAAMPNAMIITLAKA